MIDPFDKSHTIQKFIELLDFRGIHLLHRLIDMTEVLDFASFASFRVDFAGLDRRSQLLTLLETMVMVLPC